jgi:type I restriction enzyme M protein
MDVGTYDDIPGFCKATRLEEIKAHGYVLMPGSYVGAADAEDDDVPFAERFGILKAKLDEQFDASHKLEAFIRDSLGGVLRD